MKLGPHQEKAANRIGCYSGTGTEEADFIQKLWRRWRSTTTSAYGEEMAAAKNWNEEGTDLLPHVKSIRRTEVAQIE